MKRLPAFLLAANIAYLVALPSIAGKAVSAVGCLAALLLVIGPLVSRRFADLVKTELPTFLSPVSIPPLLAFALPALSLLGQPTIAFWRLDARALVIVAWLGTLSWLLAVVHSQTDTSPSTTRQGNVRPLPLLRLLFILWGALFWLMLVWDVGVGRVVLGMVREDRFTWSFDLWETRAPSEHLFLIWISRDAFARHEAYANHLHPYLFFTYGCAKLAQFASGMPLYVGRNITPFGMAAVGIVAFAVLLTRSRQVSPAAGLKFYVTLFLMLGFFVSEWHYWAYLYTTNLDNVFPLIAYLTAIVWACAQPRISDRNAGIVVASAAVFGAFGWVYTPLVVVALWCYFGRLGPTATATLAHNPGLIRASLACAVMGITTLSLPRVLIAAKGYTTSSSSLLFRSGLDGDTRYFHDVAQAVLRPFFGEAQPAWNILFPAFVPLLICLACGASGSRTTRFRILAPFVFLSAPYFFSLAVFPQSVSIHPYLYNELLFVPAVLVGAMCSLTATVQRRLRGPYLLAGLLLMVILIMSNFVAIAQAMRKALPG